MKKLFWGAIQKLKHLFDRAVRSRFVHRMILLCMVTDMVIVLLLSFIIQYRVNHLLKDQAITASVQTLDSVEAYFSSAHELVKQMNYRFYRDTATRDKLHNGLNGISTLMPNERRAFFQWMTTLYASGATNDPTNALVGINLYHIPSATTITMLESGASQDKWSYYSISLHTALDNLRSGNTQPRIYGTTTLKTNDEGIVTAGTLNIYDYVRSPDSLTDIIAILSYHYDLARIDIALHELTQDTGGVIFLVSEQGELLYASNGDYSNSLPLLDNNSTNGRTLSTTNGICIQQRNSRFHFTVVSMIPEEALYASAWSLNRFIYLCLALALLLLIVLGVVYGKALNHRVGNMISAIEKIETGQLNVILPYSNNNDELDRVSRSLNNMQQRLTVQLEQEQQAQQQKKQALVQQKDAELYALQSQINPHFLYNMLESIRMKAVMESAPDTATMICLLADIFRQNISRSTICTVGEELECCETYAQLFALRSEDGVDVLVDVEPGVRACAIPTHLLQPIIENAFVHGILPQKNESQLKISGRQSGKDIVLSVCDNGSGMDDNALKDLRTAVRAYTGGKHRIGLANVNERIRLIFGEEYGLTLESSLGAGTTVTVRIPAVGIDALDKLSTALPATPNMHKEDTTDV